MSKMFNYENFLLLNKKNIIKDILEILNKNIKCYNYDNRKINNFIINLLKVAYNQHTEDIRIPKQIIITDIKDSIKNNIDKTKDNLIQKKKKYFNKELSNDDILEKYWKMEKYLIDTFNIKPDSPELYKNNDEYIKSRDVLSFDEKTLEEYKISFKKFMEDTYFYIDIKNPYTNNYPLFYYKYIIISYTDNNSNNINNKIVYYKQFLNQINDGYKIKKQKKYNIDKIDKIKCFCSKRNRCSCNYKQKLQDYREKNNIDNFTINNNFVNGIKKFNLENSKKQFNISFKIDFKFKNYRLPCGHDGYRNNTNTIQKDNNTIISLPYIKDNIFYKFITNLEENINGKELFTKEFNNSQRILSDTNIIYNWDNINEYLFDIFLNTYCKDFNIDENKKTNILKNNNDMLESLNNLVEIHNLIRNFKLDNIFHCYIVEINKYYDSNIKRELIIKTESEKEILNEENKLNIHKQSLILLLEKHEKMNHKIIEEYDKCTFNIKNNINKINSTKRNIDNLKKQEKKQLEIIQQIEEDYNIFFKEQCIDKFNELTGINFETFNENKINKITTDLEKRKNLQILNTKKYQVYQLLKKNIDKIDKNYQFYYLDIDFFLNFSHEQLFLLLKQDEELFEYSEYNKYKNYNINIEDDILELIKKYRELMLIEKEKYYGTIKNILIGNNSIIF
jgi:hypothetical protein